MDKNKLKTFPLKSSYLSVKYSTNPTLSASENLSSELDLLEVLYNSTK